MFIQFFSISKYLLIFSILHQPCAEGRHGATTFRMSTIYHILDTWWKLVLFNIQTDCSMTLLSYLRRPDMFDTIFWTDTVRVRNPNAWKLETSKNQTRGHLVFEPLEHRIRLPDMQPLFRFQTFWLFSVRILSHGSKTECSTSKHVPMIQNPNVFGFRTRSVYSLTFCLQLCIFGCSRMISHKKFWVCTHIMVIWLYCQMIL